MSCYAAEYRGLGTSIALAPFVFEAKPTTVAATPSLAPSVLTVTSPSIEPTVASLTAPGMFGIPRWAIIGAGLALVSGVVWLTVGRRR